MNILIVSGFLGAGKTTFIQKLSEKTGKQFAVMENEYGEQGIDGSLLEQNRLKVWELTEGCICCSLKSDFAMSVLTIANSANPEYLIVEPTGVGLLSSVIANLAKIEYERIRLLQPVTIVDINCIDSYLKTFGEFYADQIKNAPTILLSKTENSNGTDIKKAVHTLKSINPSALITTYEQTDAHWWNSLLDIEKSAFKSAGKNTPDALSAQYAGSANTSNAVVSATPDLQTLSISDIRIQSIEELITALCVLIEGRFGRIYRVKGFVNINGQWAKFDIVDKRYNIETCAAMKKAKMTDIGTNLDSQALYTLFGNPL